MRMALPLGLAAVFLALGLYTIIAVNQITQTVAPTDTNPALRATLEAAGVQIIPVSDRRGTPSNRALRFALPGCPYPSFAQAIAQGTAVSTQTARLAEIAGTPLRTKTFHIDGKTPRTDMFASQARRDILQLKQAFGLDTHQNLQIAVLIHVPERCAHNPLPDLTAFWQPDRRAGVN